MMILSYFSLTVAAGLTVPAGAIILRAELFAGGRAFKGILTSSEAGFGCLAPGALNGFFKLGSQKASASAIADVADHWLADFRSSWHLQVFSSAHRCGVVVNRL
ncbi:hypothetical protein B0H14DRAFT_2613313 [Mycena olivaceomarginata]|nr:hypothetical protein B0H14DRAFT_2613313 [Mycena olivaceomarginata]